MYIPRETYCLTWFQRVPILNNSKSSSLDFFFFQSLLFFFIFIDQWLLLPLLLSMPMEWLMSSHKFQFVWTSTITTMTHGGSSSSHIVKVLTSQDTLIALLPTDDNDQAWKKRDGLVTLWLYGTLSKNLFRSTFKIGRTSREIWIQIEKYLQKQQGGSCHPAWSCSTYKSDWRPIHPHILSRAQVRSRSSYKCWCTGSRTYVGDLNA